jgi:hypothetical protein
MGANNSISQVYESYSNFNNLVSHTGRTVIKAQIGDKILSDYHDNVVIAKNTSVLWKIDLKDHAYICLEGMDCSDLEKILKITYKKN